MYASTGEHTIGVRFAAAKAILGALLAGLLAFPWAAAAQQAPIQHPGAEGCVSEGGVDGCASADVLNGPFAVAVTNDGRHAYVALLEGRAVAALARDKTTGALAQLPSPLGCVSHTGNGGLCTTGRALLAPIALAVSPDGKHVYVVSHQRDPVTITALVLFARDPGTGALTQLPGTQGCISETVPADECTPGVGVRGARSVAVSRDGKHVYVAAEGDSVAAFARDATTGALTQLPAPHGCVSQSGNGGMCTQGKALDGAHAVALSRNGKFVYVASEKSHAVAVFKRSKKTGALRQLPGEDGCIAENGSDEQCTDAVGIGNAVSLAVSPDGKNVYVTSAATDQLAVLQRDRRRGTLRSSYCIENGSGGVVCEGAVALGWPESVAVSPDGKRVYVAAREYDSVVVFARDRTSGALTQLATPRGCVSDHGHEGLCTDGRALRGPRSVTLSKNGRHVYVAAQGSKAVAVLQRRR